MMLKNLRRSRSSLGFTLVELMIVIVVIGILAAAAVVGYQGVQKRAVEASMLSDLSSSASIIENYGLQNNGIFPATDYLRSEFKSSPDISMTIVNPTIGVYYTNLSTGQNAALFVNVCNSLAMPISSGANTYASTCTGQWGMDINGGTHSSYLSTPIQQTFTLVGSACSNPDSNSAYCHPYYAAATNSTTALRNAFIAQGGTFPITMQNNANAPLPTPSPLTGPSSTYCVEATSTRFTELRYKLTSENNQPVIGGC